MHAYLYLSLAIVFEVIGTLSLKLADGFTRPFYSGVVIVAYLLCFYLFSLSLRVIPVGVAYAIWGGIGLVLIAIGSVVFLKQTLDIAAVVGISLILIGVVVLNVYSKAGLH